MGTSNNSYEHLLSVRDLYVTFPSSTGETHAVNGVSFDLDEGETLGIVGESGSGKSVTAFSIMQILGGNGRISRGKILYKGVDITHWDEKQMQSFRGKGCSVVFQDPMTSLNPLLTVGNQIVEAIKLHTDKSKEEAKQTAIRALGLVGLSDPEKQFKRYPHELSGGQRQRVMIAMALSSEPDILIADEPTTALDVTVQAQVMEQIRSLQKELGMAMILITHDLGLVAGMCSKVIVMYGGSVCESGSIDDIFYRPLHQYTRGLLRSIPTTEKNRSLVPIGGTPANAANLPEGCPFSPRCKVAMKICLHKKPPVLYFEEGHEATCWTFVRRTLEQERGVSHGQAE